MCMCMYTQQGEVQISSQPDHLLHNSLTLCSPADLLFFPLLLLSKHASRAELLKSRFLLHHFLPRISVKPVLPKKR